MLLEDLIEREYVKDRDLMANAFNVDVYANLAVCTCRAHRCPSTGVYRGAKIGSVGSFYLTRLTGVGTYGFSNRTLAVALDTRITIIYTTCKV